MAESEDRRVSIPVGQLRRWRERITTLPREVPLKDFAVIQRELAEMVREMTGAENAPGYVPGVYDIDGDLIATVVGLVCTRVGMTDTAAESIAEAAVAELAAVPGVTVLRGPDSAPWQPDPSGSTP